MISSQKAIKASDTAIIQVACGFGANPHSPGDWNALSVIDALRGQAVKGLFCPGNWVFVTGMVPYDAAQPTYTLASINTNRLTLEYRLERPRIRLIPGLNAFSESYNACVAAKAMGIEKIIVVSSDFYFEAYRRMWRAAGRRHGLVVEIVSLVHSAEASPEVVAFYKGFQAQTLSTVAASSSLGHWLARTVADYMTKDRLTKGFNVDGHTKLR